MIDHCSPKWEIFTGTKMQVSNWWAKTIDDLEIVSIKKLKTKHPDVNFYVSMDFYEYFKNISQKNNLAFPIQPLHSKMSLKTKSEIVAIIGTPESLIINSCNYSRDNPIIIITIPVESVLLKFNMLKQPINPIQYSHMCFPFVPFAKCLYLPVGPFTKLFFEEPLHEKSSIKAALLALTYLFGSFRRTYGIGDISSVLAEGFLDSIDASLPPAPNNLIIIDRSVDFPGAFKASGTYFGLAEEFLKFDYSVFSLQSSIQAELFQTMTSVFGVDDETSKEISLLTLEEAKKRTDTVSRMSTYQSSLKAIHKNLISIIEGKLKTNYLSVLFQQVQNLETEALGKGRILTLDDNGPNLAFRALTMLYSKKSKEVNDFAQYIGSYFKIPTFAKWARIESFLNKSSPISIPEIVFSILSNGIKKGKPVVEPFYQSTNTQIPDDPQRWFIVVLGGLTGHEIMEMETKIKVFRPKDDFIIIPTEVSSPSTYMNTLLS